jgi:hypothetical protein
MVMPKTVVTDMVAVCIAKVLRAGHLEIGLRFPAAAKTFVVYTVPISHMKPTQPSLQWVVGDRSSGTKRLSGAGIHIHGALPHFAIHHYGLLLK